MCFIPQNEFGIHPLRRFGGYHHGDGDVPFWGYPGLVDQIILIGMMEAGILSVFFAISWYRPDPDGITKCTYFYKKTFAWCEIQDIYLTTYDTMKNSGGTVECVVLSKKIRQPRLSYEAANSFTHRDCAMAFALNSPERKANIFAPYIEKDVFLDFAARRGLTISNL